MLGPKVDTYYLLGAIRIPKACGDLVSGLPHEDVQLAKPQCELLSTILVGPKDVDMDSNGGQDAITIKQSYLHPLYCPRIIHIDGS